MAKRGRPISPEWVTTPRAAAALSVSPDWLYSMVEHWKQGYHYRDLRKPTSTRANYRWHLKRIEEWGDKDASRR